VRSHAAGPALLMYRRIDAFTSLVKIPARHMRLPEGLATCGWAAQVLVGGNTVSHISGRHPIGGCLAHARRQMEKDANVRLTVQQRTESPCTNHEGCDSAAGPEESVPESQRDGPSQHDMWEEAEHAFEHAPGHQVRAFFIRLSPSGRPSSRSTASHP
jgi:hypothetical protein